MTSTIYLVCLSRQHTLSPQDVTQALVAPVPNIHADTLVTRIQTQFIGQEIQQRRTGISTACRRSIMSIQRKVCIAWDCKSVDR